ncbi:MAG: DMT family transporter [Gaiellales bacterium]|nr:DMT family transporter [Gaiellales bacterium]
MAVVHSSVHPDNRAPDRRSLAAIGVTLFLWSSAFAGIRVGLQAFSPGHLALFRFLVASVGFLIYALVARLPLPRLRDVPALLVLGALGITIYHTALNFAEVRVSAGSASILVATSPIFTAVFAAAFLRERLSGRAWLGVAAGFGGAVLVAFGEGGGLHLEPYALLVLLSAVSSAAYFVMMKPMMRRYTSIQLTVYSVILGTALLLVFTPGLPAALAAAPPSATLTVAYLGLLPGGLAYIAWTYALARTSAARLATFQYLVPALAILVAWVWTREPPLPLALLGGALSTAGVILVNSMHGRGRRSAR